MEEAFKLSYIENSLTSNPILAPLATRDMADLYQLADKAAGRDISTNALKHGYSGAEINEIVAVLQRLMAVREVVYRVNQQYIASAAQADNYRTEPPFKLQGSYRNMNKLAEKISPVMNDDELAQLITDHYLGESQLLTTGAEENLLKLAELRNGMSPEQQARWAQIRADFLRNKAMGGNETDVGGRVVAQLADIAAGLQSMKPEDREPTAAVDPAPWQDLLDALKALQPQPARTTPAQAGSGTQLADAVAGIARQQAPMLEILRASLARQDILNQTLIDLFDRLGNTHKPASPPPADNVQTGNPHGNEAPVRVRTSREIAFDRELANLRFREDLEAADKPTSAGSKPGAAV
jgi:hypothetical protein